MFFKELAAIEVLLIAGGYDDAEPDDPCLSDGIPLYDVYPAYPTKAVRYAVSPQYFNVAGKRVRVQAYMYSQNPSFTPDPTWWFNLDCYEGGDSVTLLAGYKSTGDEVVGSFVDYSNDPNWNPALYTGPTTLCKQ